MTTMVKQNLNSTPAFDKRRQELMKELESIIGPIIDAYTKEIEQIYDSAIEEALKDIKLIHKPAIKNPVS